MDSGAAGIVETACNRISCRAKLSHYCDKSLHYDKTKSAVKISVLHKKHPTCGEKNVSCSGKIWFYAGDNRAKVTFLRSERPFFAKQAAYAHVYARKGFLEREIEKNLI